MIKNFNTEYYDQNAKFLYADNEFSGGKVKLMTNQNWETLSKEYGAHLEDRTESYHDTMVALEENSKTIPIASAEAQRDFSTMIQSLRQGKERGGYIIYSTYTIAPKLYFQLLPTIGEPEELNMSTSGYLNLTDLIIATVHTHPNEFKYIDKVYGGNATNGISSVENFTNQYRKANSDGNTANKIKTPMYTIGTHVNYFSPIGKLSSLNNICTNAELMNGTFDILKHALQAYGKEHFI